MAGHHLVSVIIPTYNRAELLPRALESVLAQTYKHVEIIVIDDGSTDSTKAILEKYSKNIRIIHADHCGTANARNLGMAASEGEYICFLDSDDSYYPYKIEAQVEVIEAHPEIDMISTEVSGIFPDGIADEYHLKNYHPTYDKYKLTYDTIYSEKTDIRIECVNKIVPLYTGNIFKFALLGTLIMSNTVLFKRKILDVVGYQDQRFKYGQDYNFVTRICKCFNVGFIDIPTYNIYYHDGQATRFVTKKHSANKHLKYIEAYNTLLTTVSEHAFDDKDYYLKHTVEVDARIAELKKDIGYMLFDCGEFKKAAGFLRSAYKVEKKKFPLLRSYLVPLLFAAKKQFIQPSD
jgi:glycosyltransferase involved in cell wall biosynthesis